MVMDATVMGMHQNALLVRNDESGEEALVSYCNAKKFSAGDHVRITGNGDVLKVSANYIQRIIAVPKNVPEVPFWQATT